jgi:hypothetical protein
MTKRNRISRRHVVTLSPCHIALCFLALATSVPACNKPTGTLVPVEGQVLLDGKPLAMNSKTLGTVILYPDKSKGNDSLEIPRGPIDAEGKFKILTGIKPGVAPGWYKVSVTAAKVIDPKNPYHSASDFLMPQRYLDKEKSNLALEAKENAPAGYDLKLESRN